MKIGIDIRPLMDKEYSGVSWYTLDLLTEILRQDQRNEYLLYYNSARDISSRLPKFDQTNVKVVGTHYPNKFFNYFLQKVLGWPKIDQLLGGVDVFWSPHFNFSTVSGKTKNILTVHDLSFLAYPEFFSARKNLWHRFLNIKKLIHRADLIIAISENTKVDLVRYFRIPPEKIRVIYSGVGSEFRRLAIDDPQLVAVKNKYKLPDKFILNLGAFEPRKNIVGLINAFDAAVERIGTGDWHLVLAGSKGWKNKEIFQAIGRAKHREQIKIIGYVEQNERVALYNLAQIFVYPSFYEGFGLPVLESMASGTPVITSAVSALPEVTGDAAILIDPIDDRSISEALQAMMKDDKLRDLYSSRGLECAKNFSWKKTAEQYIKLFLNQ